MLKIGQIYKDELGCSAEIKWIRPDNKDDYAQVGIKVLASNGVVLLEDSASQKFVKEYLAENGFKEVA